MKADRQVNPKVRCIVMTTLIAVAAIVVMTSAPDFKLQEKHFPADLYLKPEGCQNFNYKIGDSIHRQCFPDRYKIADPEALGFSSDYDERRLGWYRIADDMVKIKCSRNANRCYVKSVSRKKFVEATSGNAI